MNLLKVTDRWRSLLRQARVAELRGNISVFQQTFEREVDELDFITEVNVLTVPQLLAVSACKL